MKHIYAAIQQYEGLGVEKEINFAKSLHQARRSNFFQISPLFTFGFCIFELRKKYLGQKFKNNV